MTLNARSFLASLFNAAVAAADPGRIVAAHLPPHPKGRTVVIGAGKGVAQLAQAFERVWDGPLQGTVVTRYGYGAPRERIEVLEAAHPIPDENGLMAAARLFDRVRGLTEDDLVVALVCGGGSALLPAPAGNLTLADEIAVNETLLTSGAPISAMNVIRKSVSAIKGGRLALAAWPARVVSLVVSDVPGDDPAEVASGPTVPSSTGPADALRLIRLYGVRLSDRVLRHLASDAAQSPAPEDPHLAGHAVTVIASAARSLEAAATEAQRCGITPAILSDAVEGEAREVAKLHGAIAREVALRNRPFVRPIVLLSGGETTVTGRAAAGNVHA